MVTCGLWIKTLPESELLQSSIQTLQCPGEHVESLHSAEEDELLPCTFSDDVVLVFKNMKQLALSTAVLLRLRRLMSSVLLLSVVTSFCLP